MSVSKALQYAETNLGVHACYQAAKDAHEALDDILNALDKAQDNRRILVDDIADREAELLIEERGKHPDQSATWLDQHMKQVKRKDEKLRDLRSMMNEAQARISGLEYDVDIQKHRIKIETARMEELGGYLHYLAAIKQAETLTKTTKPNSQENQ